MFSWLNPPKCGHEHVRCVHGDEIISIGFKRVICLDCGTPLDGPMPVICYYTQQPHTSLK